MNSTPSVRIERRPTGGAVIVENDFDTDLPDLWDALTDPTRLARWLVEVTGDPQSVNGAALRFTSGWEGTGRVQECDPPRRLSVETTTDDGEKSIITATLTSLERGTHLRIEESGLPLDGLDPHAAGWQVHVEDLGVVLTGGTPQPWREQWLEAMASRKREPRHES